MLINNLELNKSLPAGSIDAQLEDVNNDIKTVKLQLAAIDTELRNVKKDIDVVETCRSKMYSEWSDDAKNKYGVKGGKNSLALESKLKNFLEDKAYLQGKDKSLRGIEMSLRGIEMSLLDKKHILLQLVLQRQGTKRAKHVSYVRQEEAKQRGNDFVKSIMAHLQLEVIVEGELYYMKDVYRPSGAISNIILSQTIRDFWSSCIENVDQGKRVCASGSPGVGKSTSMLYLIWVLLTSGKRVVYITRTPDNTGFYYEWNIKKDGFITSNVYPESIDIRDIIDEKAEDFKETYFLCDPGRTTFDITPPPDFLVNMIVNASTDEMHWGGSEFTKQREDNFYAKGLILVFPMLTKEQLFLARTKFNDYPDEQTLEERHRDVGSIPRHLFENDEKMRKQRIIVQDGVVNCLSYEMARNIVNGIEDMNNNNKHSPKSIITCVTSQPPDFMESTVSFVSDRVVEETAKRHMALLWQEISSEDNSSNLGILFEAYVRTLFCGRITIFRTRSCCGKTVPKGVYKKITKLPFGGCSRIQRSTHIIEDCRSGKDGIIFYSYNEKEPLVDFLYKVEKKYYAIQVTIGATHDCANDALTTFLENLDLQEDETLTLAYAVPNIKFSYFTTNPVQPKVQDNIAHLVSICHVEILPPGQNV